MIKRVISVFVVIILVFSICGCAQTTKESIVAETENVEIENTETQSKEETDTEPEESESGETAISEEEMDIQEITWEQVDYNDVVLHFILGDGSVFDREIVAYSVQEIVYEDITGDDTDETLIYCDFANNTCDWQLIYFYQIDSGNLTDISPSSKDIPELDDADGGIWNMWQIDAGTEEGYSSPVYKLERYDKEEGVTYVEETLYIGYKDGKWELVQGF